MKVSTMKRDWQFLSVILAIVLLYGFLPLGTAFQFGGDEGYELITGFLMSKGYVLYTQIWNDQPPLLVLLLDLLFKIFGPSILAARLLAAGFGLLMFAAFFQTVKIGSGKWAALIGTFLLLASPGILEISVSVMQEVPTFALVLLSLWCLLRSRPTGRSFWLVVSGSVFGLAMATKLTAMIAFPAMILELVLRYAGDRKVSSFKRVGLALLQWGGVLAITFTCVLVLWGRGSFESSYRAHFAEHQISGMGKPDDFPPNLAAFLDNSECVAAALLAVVFIFRRRQLGQFTVPLTWLATAILIHAVHRPWWMYYYLHLAIPMAWLAGFALCELLKPFCLLLSSAALNLSSRRTWGALALAALVAIVLVRSEQRIEGGFLDLRHRQTIRSNPLLAKMRQFGGRTHWIYVRYTQEAYAFHAQLLTPPELAVVTLKRFWSDQISPAEIQNICKRYRPEQLILDPMDARSNWSSFLTNYSLAYLDHDNALYVLRAGGDEIQQPRMTFGFSKETAVGLPLCPFSAGQSRPAVQRFTDLTLEPPQIIQSFGFTVEIQHRGQLQQAIHTLGAYVYHFWMQDMTPIRRGSRKQHVQRKGEHYRPSRSDCSIISR